MKPDSDLRMAALTDQGPVVAIIVGSKSWTKNSRHETAGFPVRKILKRSFPALFLLLGTMAYLMEIFVLVFLYVLAPIVGRWVRERIGGFAA